MKKLVVAAIALTIAASAAFAQSTTNSTNPKLSSEDTTKQNPSTDRSTVGPRNAADGAEHRRQDKPDRATQPGRATNAGSRNNANNESKVSTGGKVNQASKANAATDPASQPARARIGSGQSGNKKDN